MLTAVFSSRLPRALAPNRLTTALARLRASEVRVIDLTESNPTSVGLEYPPGLLDELSRPAGLLYRPDPFGLKVARAAVVRYLSRSGLTTAPERVILTASTSEAYGFLFKLLCDPGDAVLVPRPSYPLFEHLTDLEAVQAVPYQLDYHGRWSVDLASLRRSITPRARAVLVVNPNNPTGSYLSRAELDAIADICREHDLALIGDEVFASYPLVEGPTRPVSVLDHGRDVLTISLGGLSKAVGLPQLKVAWMVVHGGEATAAAARAGLELVCDTYLSVATPVQLALETLLTRGAVVARQIAERIRGNYVTLCELALRHPSSSVLPAEGGWYAVVQVPSTRSEETLVLELLEHEHVLVHPGYFFDFAREAFVVVSLLVEPERLRDGVTRMLEYANR